jgi:hypothetical protein
MQKIRISLTCKKAAMMQEAPGINMVTTNRGFLQVNWYTLNSRNSAARSVHKRIADQAEFI